MVVLPSCPLSFVQCLLGAKPQGNWFSLYSMCAGLSMSNPEGRSEARPENMTLGHFPLHLQGVPLSLPPQGSSGLDPRQTGGALRETSTSLKFWRGSN